MMFLNVLILGLTLAWLHRKTQYLSTIPDTDCKNLLVTLFVPLLWSCIFPSYRNDAKNRFNLDESFLTLHT